MDREQRRKKDGQLLSPTLGGGRPTREREIFITFYDDSCNRFSVPK